MGSMIVTCDDRCFSKDACVYLSLALEHSDYDSQVQYVDPIRFHHFDVSIDVTVIIDSEFSCRRVLKTSEI